MNNKLTWLFIISSLFLSWGTVAQEKEEVKPKQEEKNLEPMLLGLVSIFINPYVHNLIKNIKALKLLEILRLENVFM